MDIEEIRDYALALTGVTEDQPFGDDNIVFRIGGKIFICLSLNNGGCGSELAEPHFALKLKPERNEELREKYEEVTPAWHWNKKHWSDVFYTNLDSNTVKAWIDEAYGLVMASLPKKTRMSVSAIHNV